MTRYREVADRIAARIHSGEFPLGTKLQPMDEFAREYGVSLVTARSAILRLEREGYLSVRQGIGTYVICTEPISKGELATEAVRRELKIARDALKRAEDALHYIEEAGQEYVDDDRR